ncbi:50S ribosomal protein L15 [Candidatus Gastranaerophilus sp. (ex Termes propinquus)]|nr:50S ribosomal protein L15 [Candidatus Gastranaerophilus sp. (ex Termes propinquus)]
MITLEDLKPETGSVKKSKRVGRGRSSGHGKTCCRGHNGEGQRSGRSAKRGFEGGQMPAFRRVPKLKGFKNFAALNAAEINVGAIDKLGVDVVDLEYLVKNQKAHPSSDVLRVLGSGEITKAVTIRAAHFTQSAKEKIEKAGGKVEII